MDKQKKYSGYTCIQNSVLRNERLSLGARGLLSFMISCPPNWNFNLYGLCRDTNTKRTKMGNYLNELQKEGYIKRIIARENGKIKYFTFEINQDGNL